MKKCGILEHFNIFDFVVKILFINTNIVSNYVSLSPVKSLLFCFHYSYKILLLFVEVDVYAGRPAQGHSGNLTGNRRILKDTAADVFNRMQTWKVHQDRACVVISNIFNLRMKL